MTAQQELAYLLGRAQGIAKALNKGTATVHLRALADELGIVVNAELQTIFNDALLDGFAFGRQATTVKGGRRG